MQNKRERFKAEYKKDLNATQAAIRAGYSKKTAYSQGQRLLKNAEIKESIEKSEAKRAEKCEIDAQWIIEKFKNIHELGINGEKKQLSAANNAIENIARHTGFYAADNAQVKANVELIIHGLEPITKGKE